MRRCSNSKGRSPRASSSAGALASDDGAGKPVLVVTATGREADELTAALGALLGTSRVADFPSWETLPHERLSPRADTVGRRLEVLHRLKTGADDLRVVVATVRSLIQPMAPGLGSLAPVDLIVGEEQSFDALLQRLVELAYTRVDMVEKRGEFAVRGGILDLFGPTAQHPVRVEFWGDEVSEIRAFAVSDQRSLPGEIPRVTAPPCRELLLTQPVKDKAAELAKTYEADAHLSEMLTKLADGIPVEGMEALIPVLCEGELELLTDAMPVGTHVLLTDPEKIRARAADLVRTGQEFLEASWTTAAAGGLAPIDLGSSAYRGLEGIASHAQDTKRTWWTLSQLTSEDPDVYRVSVEAAPAYRGEIDRATADLRAHTAAGGTAVLVVAGQGTAARAVEQLSSADVPASLAGDGVTGSLPPGTVTVTCGALTEGFVSPERALVVLSEADLTGRGAGCRNVHKGPHHQDAVAAAQRRRPAGPQERRLRRPRAARHRPVRRDGAAHRQPARPASTCCWSTARPSAVTPATGCSSRPTSSTRCPSTSAASCPRSTSSAAPTGRTPRRGPRRPSRRSPPSWSSSTPRARPRPGTRSARTRRGRASWKTPSRSPRPTTSSPRSTRSSRTCSAASRWTA